VPAWGREYPVLQSGTVNVPAQTETVVVTSAGMSTPQPNLNIMVIAYCLLTFGTLATSCIWRIRRATLTGTIVGNPVAEAVTAATTQGFSVQVLDVPGDVASQVYVLTATTVGAGTACTSNYSSILGIIAA
jgi:hypothetical protein